MLSVHFAGSVLGANPQPSNFGSKAASKDQNGLDQATTFVMREHAKMRVGHQFNRAGVGICLWLTTGGFLILALTDVLVHASELKPEILPLWDGHPPGFVKDSGPEKTFPQWPGTVGNVSIPSLAVYLPPADKANGMAIIYCSGGSYNKVSAVSDEVGDAACFTERGVALVVLKYRTSPPSKDFSAALQDAQRAVRVVRHHAADWKIDPRKIGMLGGSAGGHLILTSATRWDAGHNQAIDPVERQSCRPDFLTLLCPWPNKQPASDFKITKETPPVLICSARDDEIAPIGFAEEIVQAYHAVGVDAKLWAIENGGHSAFSNMRTAPGAAWIDEFWKWWTPRGFGPR